MPDGHLGPGHLGDPRPAIEHDHEHRGQGHEAPAGCPRLRVGGEAWADREGGTSGALWGAGLLAAAQALPPDAVPTGPDVVSAVVAAWVQVTTIGGAQVGDKTLVDAIEPFAQTLRRRTEDGDDLRTAWAATAATADEGATSTRAMAARMGRSRVLGEKSLGTPDPGATSLAACMRALEPLMGQDERIPTTEERR